MPCEAAEIVILSLSEEGDRRDLTQGWEGRVSGLLVNKRPGQGWIQSSGQSSSNSNVTMLGRRCVLICVR